MAIDRNRGLIVFLKPPSAGKIKTRLASEVGAEEALRIYQKLLRHTLHVINGVDAYKYIFLSEPGELSMNLPKDSYTVQVQQGKDLGERMKNAFQFAFDDGVSEALIIGSDNIEITPAILNDAFEKLLMNDVVIGPSNDGGYYLLGINQLIPALFEKMEWSTSTVLEETVKRAEALESLQIGQLEMLADIDYWQDVKDANWHTLISKIEKEE